MFGCENNNNNILMKRMTHAISIKNNHDLFKLEKNTH